MSRISTLESQLLEYLFPLLEVAALRSTMEWAFVERKVDIRAARAWLSALEASNQVRLLEPWFTNRTKSLVKSPRLYLCDSAFSAN